MARKKLAQKRQAQKHGHEKLSQPKKKASKTLNQKVKQHKNTTGKQRKMKVALYARTSSAANAASHSTTRQLEAANSVLQPSGVPRSCGVKIDKVAEVISGMLPLTEWKNCRTF